LVNIARDLIGLMQTVVFNYVSKSVSDLEDDFENAHAQLLRQNEEKASEIFLSLSHHLSASLVTFLTKFDILYLLLGVSITIQVRNFFIAF